MKRILIALALLVSAPAFAGEGAPWRAVDAQTGQISDLAELEQLARDFPDSSSVRRRLLGPMWRAGDVEGILDLLDWLKARGYVFSENGQSQLQLLLGAPHEESVRERLLPRAEAIEASEVVATVPAEAGLVESVFVPQAAELMVATSVTGNSIHIRDFDGSWHSIPVPGANDLSGIVGEPDDSMGWAASANLDNSVEEEPLFTGLMGLRGDFSNPILVPAPEGASVSDLSIGSDSTVYASDPLGGSVFRKPIGARELEVLVAPGTFRSPQGSAPSEDGTRLYVSDYRYGLAIIDIESGAVSRLSSDVPAMLDGIDGLWRHGNELIAVQNGVSPMRIIGLTLSQDGNRITSLRVLEQAHPGWTEPLGGSVADGALYYVATGQWDRFEAGEPVEGKPPIATEIRRLPLETGAQ